ncbi:MAG: DUF6602 domain-containing protein [Cyanobacteriota bacterium]
MNNILEQYYRGITQKLRSEVDLINSLFQHQGLKGEGNEIILRELLKNFIPKKYSIGTGVVIDRKGNQSRQCDIIIYDNFLYPSFLSLSTVHLFPVEIVYATIEVKTTLNTKSAKEALENIASVRKLGVISDKWYHLSEGESVSMIERTPSPPIGYVFAYSSKTPKFETFKNWFIPPPEANFLDFPFLVGCLDQGLVRFTSLIPQIGVKPDAMAFPLRISGKVWEVHKRCKHIDHEGLFYPVKQIEGKYYAIDQSNVLLNFIFQLNQILISQRLNPSIQFAEHYFPDSMKQCFLV